jgi:uncharacterized RDD family membrane protein YckC
MELYWNIGTKEWIMTKYVGFWARVLATLIDSVLIMAITLPPLLAIYGLAYLENNEAVSGLADILISNILPMILVILFWTKKQATPGKMAVSAKIVDAETGGKPSKKQCVGRYFAYILSAIPLGLGFLWVAFDPKKQSWHDKLAGTVVVKVSRSPKA